MGRVIHLTELKQQLVSQKQLNFDASRSNINIIQKLEILAETVYVEVNVCFPFVEVHASVLSSRVCCKTLLSS